MRGLLLSLLAATGCGLTLDLTPPVTDGGGGNPDGGFLDAGLDAIPPDARPCTTIEDCEGLVRMEPSTTCGDYRCEGGFCLANDLDGDGLGPGCDQPDCDDRNESIGSDALIACPGAPPGICGEEATLTCRDGSWAMRCEGIQLPRPEACNGRDDDCNGIDDDGLDRSEDTIGCPRTYSCVDGGWVISTPASTMEVCDDGIDNDCDGLVDGDDAECALERCIFVGNDDDPRLDFETLDEAINASSAVGNPVYCLMAGAEGGGCRPSLFPISRDIPPGSTILGNLRFRPDGTPDSCPTPRTTMLVSDGESTVRVNGPGSVVLSNLAVRYPPRGDAEAIRVTETLVVLNDVHVVATGLGAATSISTGIYVDGGGSILAVATAVSTYGILSTGIKASEGNVALLAGCSGGACSCSGTDGIHGRGNGMHALTVDSGTLVVESSAVCGSGAPALFVSQSSVFAAGSMFATASGDDIDAVEISCSPGIGVWFHDNDIFNEQVVSGSATGVWAYGGCAPLLTSNRIRGMTTGSATDVFGVTCDSTDCVLGQNDIVGVDRVAGAAGSVGIAVGLHCEGNDTANCRILSQNQIVGSLSPMVDTAIGVELSGSQAFVERNRVRGGCGGSNAEGMYIDSSDILGRANEIIGGACEDNTRMGEMKALVATGSVLDWVGNSMDAGVAASGDCNAVGAVIDGVPRLSLVRNNVFLGGMGCGYRVGADIDDRAMILLHNGFAFANDPLIFGGNTYSDPAALLADYPLWVGQVFGGADATAGFSDYPNTLAISRASPFAGAGRAPAGLDIDGNVRPLPPSIGAYEP